MSAKATTIATGLTRLLALAGAIPFVACAAALLLGITTVPLLGLVTTIAASYGLLILAFMAGVHWGQQLSGLRTSLNLFLISNAIALAGWFSYLLLPQRLFFASLAALFAVLLMVDRSVARDGNLTPEYMRTRSLVSAIVVVCLAVIALKV
jgi:hypothetical protein